MKRGYVIKTRMSFNVFFETYILLIVLLLIFAGHIFCQERQENYAESKTDEEFVQKYERWLPELLISPPRSTSDNPPHPNINGGIRFFGEIYKQGKKDNILCRVVFHWSEHPIYHDCPFPELMKQLVKIHYNFNVSEVPLYTVFPLLGRFYYVDSLEGGREGKNSWQAFVRRLKKNELPEDIKLHKESIVFTINTELQKKHGDNSGHLYSYRIFVTDIAKINPDNADLHAKIKVIGNGSRQIEREGWYKIGDVIEFSHFSHKIINIVSSRELDKEIQGHKCNLVGYIELAPEAVPLDKPKLEEIEILPDPPERPAPEPKLTNEEKAEMRIWKVITPENKTVEVQAAFVKLENERVTLIKPNTDYGSLHLKYFSASDQKFIRDIIEQRKKYSAEAGIKFELISLSANPIFWEEDEENETLLQVIGEKIELALKIKNVSNDIISICKAKLQTSNSYNVSIIGGYIKSVFGSEQPVPISFNQKDWLTLKPGEEYVYPIPQNKFASWRLPQNGEKINFSHVGYYVFSFRHDRLDIPLEIRKKLVESGIPGKIYVGAEHGFAALRSFQFDPPPIEHKEFLLQKVIKYIERSFSRDEVAEILKENEGVDVYSDNAK
ncbi:MAG: hypothetical protein LBC74_01605, partial [Planctomycetaceae bacterium]|nr:hypothetical protein [Planctomycetaceae bacterium]